MVLQILQKFLGFLSECHKIRRQDVHIKAGTDGPFLLVNLCLVQIAQFTLDRFQGGILVEGFGMELTIWLPSMFKMLFNSVSYSLVARICKKETAPKDAPERK